MMKARISALVLAATFMFGASAHARGGGSGGILFDANLFYSSEKIETSSGGTYTASSDGTTAIYDIKLGYLGGSGLYLGGIYTSRSNSVLNQAGTSGSAMGASVGYMSDAGLFVQAHYLMSASLGTYSDGSGYQADFGYKAGIGTGWLLGAELTYRSVEYKKNTSGAAVPYRDTEVMPMVSIGYMF